MIAMAASHSFAGRVQRGSEGRWSHIALPLVEDELKASVLWVASKARKARLGIVLVANWFPFSVGPKRHIGIFDGTADARVHQDRDVLIVNIDVIVIATPGPIFYRQSEPGDLYSLVAIGPAAPVACTVSPRRNMRPWE
jgi:hypothetical protein